MSLVTAARIARRELRGGLSGFRIFLLCLILGVAAIAGVGSLRAGIEAGLSRDGAALLGGDAEIELTYRFATPSERAWMDSAATRVSEVADFRSMVVRGDERGLTQVKAVDGAYPLLGEVVLEPAMPLAAALAGQNGLPGAVMAPLLIDRMGLGLGQTFRLGTQDFVLMAALQREPDDAGAGFALGPRTLVALPALSASGLLAPGTLYDTKYRLDLPATLPLADAEAAARAADGLEQTQLLVEMQRPRGTPGALALNHEIPRDLARTQQHALDARRRHRVVTDDRTERARHKLFRLRGSSLQTKHRLRCEDNHWTTLWICCVEAQQVEVRSRS